MWLIPASLVMFRKPQMNLFGDQAVFGVPDSTPQAVTKHRNTYTCVHVCAHAFVFLLSENSGSRVQIRLFPPVKHHEASTDLGDPYCHGIRTSGSLDRQNGAMWPAFTAQRLSWLLIYLTEDGTYIIVRYQDSWCL